ncbi:MAG: hypothetical protein KUL82_03625 [Bdellovibrio sp.]|nr:hypothetical protein [Bdellovibrio sp.]
MMLRNFSISLVFTVCFSQGILAQWNGAPHDRVEGAIYREVGRVIGGHIGREIINSLSPRDRLSFLEVGRQALRGSLLMRYAFQGSDFRNRVYGYMMTTREGRDGSGRLCREIEMDLIYQLQRHYERSVACLDADGSWEPTAEGAVNFPPRGTPGVPPGAGGGWLPPL